MTRFLEFASRQPTTLGMSVFDDEVLPVFVAELGEPLLEGLVVRGDNGCRSQYSDPEDSRRWLGLGGERRREAESKNDREPDQPHGHLSGGWLAGSLADEPRVWPRATTNRGHGTRLSRGHRAWESSE